MTVPLTKTTRQRTRPGNAGLVWPAWRRNGGRTPWVVPV